MEPNEVTPLPWFEVSYDNGRYVYGKLDDGTEVEVCKCRSYEDAKFIVTMSETFEIDY